MQDYLVVLIGMFTIMFIAACGSSDEDLTKIKTPVNYEFLRNGESTVSYNGQSQRIAMATELVTFISDPSTSDVELALEMYRNAADDGSGADPYSDAELNTSTKSVKSKTAASTDYFSSNTAEAATYKSLIEAWIGNQVNEINAFSNELASSNKAGQILDGSSVRYVSAKGLEYNQLINKTLIGALMVDQMLNNYLGTTVLDAGDNVIENTNKTIAEDEVYTTMEHKWDEAYGYLFGNSDFPASPLTDLGSDFFLNKYLSRVEGDEDFAGVAQTIFDALALGRAAIVENDYVLRDQQADIIKEQISNIIGIRAVYYLQQAKFNLQSNPVAYGAMFHDLSEGIGFIYSLRFTQNPMTSTPYFDKSETDAMLDQLIGTDLGLWELTAETLDSLSEQIAGRFDFTVTQAGS